MKKTFTSIISGLILACCYLSSFAQAPQPELLWYRFNETGTTVTNYASSPPAGTATATIEGAHTQGAAGQCGGALIGGGGSSSSNYVNTNWVTDLNGTSWTISFWSSNIPSTTTTYYVLGDVNAGGLRVFTGGVAGAGNWILRGSLTDVSLPGGANANPTLNTFVYDLPNNQIRAYLNGNLVTTVNQSTVTISGTGPFKVGGYGTSNSLPSGSLMDEFRLYNRALTVQEIQSLLNAADYSSTTETACNSFTTAGGDVYTQSGVYNDTVSGINGCDSIITYNLTINNTTTSTINPVLCAGGTYTSPAGNVYTSTGTYIDTIPNSAGCDSIITINLILGTPTSSTITVSACATYTAPSGQVFTTSGTYNDTIANSAGCDSVITINLTINSGCDPAFNLYYRFNENGTTVTNYADNPPANAQTATIMGGVTQNAGGLCGGALIGSGAASSTDYLNTGWQTNIPSSFTISFWTKDFGQTPTLYYIFGDGSAGSFRCFTNGVAGANNWILRGTGITDTYINGGATAAPHMCTFVYDATLGNIKGYLDGVLVTTVAQSTPFINGTGPFKVMGYNSNVGAPLNGKIDEFRLYTRALSAAEVLALNNTTTYSTITETACDSYTAPGGTVYTASGVYNDTIVNVNGCDSVITINLTINNSTTSTITETACDTYTAPDGAIYTASGTYTAVLTNAAGCDSTITINLTINNSTISTITESVCDSYTAPDGATYTSSGTYTAVINNAAGCDSTITINLTVNNSTSSTITETVCDSYTAPDGATYTTSGTYTAVINNAAGCDSTITINLTVNNSTASTVTETACDSYTAPDGAIYNTSGTYTAVINNAAGCDSTITINLTVNSSTTSTVTETACDSYTAPDGATYNTSGTYTAVINNAAGCDSTITINLTVNSSTSSTITETACDSYTAPDGATYNTSGTYTAVINNAAGCDSTITINLTVNNSTASTITETSCGTYTSPAGNTYTTSGTYTDIITNAAGCDSTITINLTVNQPTASTISANGCGSYTSPAGNVYTTSGTYTDVITNAAGCDSTITINLTITNINNNVTQSGSTLTANQGAATYEWIECSGTANLSTSQSYTPTVTGNYAVVITQNNCSDTSDCINVVISGIGNVNIAANTIKAFPNPTNGLLTISTGVTFEKATLKLTTLTGQVVLYTENVNGNLYSFDMAHLAEGVYIAEISMKDSKWQVRVVKN